ncbi:MAG: class I SAM-dependent rRNA methyltransferase [Saprospiraceae bacterium]|nr:class I SAM-dependent rRNA methyltransferase [Saprospiraceae bacterium]
MEYKGIVKIKKGREQNLLRKHPWIFSGAIYDKPTNLEDGDLVQLADYTGNIIGFGHFHNGSIAIKILGFGKVNYESSFWLTKLSAAFELRKVLMARIIDTNCFRWVHGEGDGLPGLIIDVYADTLVIQCHSIGMHRQIMEIAEACAICFDNQNINIIDKSKDCLPAAYGRAFENRLISGNSNPVIVKENGLFFEIDPIHGQKTGFFLDQRENRKLLGEYAKGRKILNAFCYTGGFSIYAASNDALEISSIDISQKAIDGCLRNFELNAPNRQLHTEICEDVYDYLKRIPSDHFDMIVLDPPAFAKTLDKRHHAVQAYKRLNHLAMKKIQSGGILFTFSCSQVVGEDLFYNTIVSAGIESGRNIRVVHKLTQAPDHPVNLFHPEGNYLKGLVLFVE